MCGLQNSWCVFLPSVFLFLFHKQGQQQAGLQLQHQLIAQYSALDLSDLHHIAA